MPFTKIVSAELHEAAVRAGVRTAAQSLGTGFVIPATLTVAFTGEWFAALGIGIALAVVVGVVNGAQAYFSFIGKGIPEQYAQAVVLGQHAAVPSEGPDPASP